MNLAIDSSSIINLTNGAILCAALDIPEKKFFICPAVAKECGPGRIPELLKLAESGHVNFLDDSDLAASVFLKLLDEHGLGYGETECFTCCLHRGMGLVCDDKKARTIAKSILGGRCMTGSLGLLKKMVSLGRVTAEQAHSAYLQMVSNGAFLPVLSEKFFVPALDHPAD